MHLNDICANRHLANETYLKTHISIEYCADSEICEMLQFRDLCFFYCYAVMTVSSFVFLHTSFPERHFVIIQHSSVHMCSVFAAVQLARMVHEAESLLKFLQLILHGCMCHKVFHSCQM